MSTRLTKGKSDGKSRAMGHEGANIPEDFELPPCTIEDTDRALFNLFDKEIPFFYKHKGEMKRVPVIFATGERFAILRRKKPLRDKTGALILPLISIVRQSIEQSAKMGPGQGSPLTIKRRLSKRDPRYQAIINKPGIRNQDNVATDANKLGNEIDRDVADTPRFAVTGTVSGRNTKSLPKNSSTMFLKPSLSSKNIYEIITVSPAKFYTATYEVTFWAQYMQEMNDLLSSMMSTYQDNRKLTFKLETPQGYWFVAYIGAQLNSAMNVDDFTGEERLIRYSFEVKVPAYLIAANYPGAPSPVRSFISAPEISFNILDGPDGQFDYLRSGIPSGDPDAYILQDVLTDADGLPGQAVGNSSLRSAMVTRGNAVPGAAISNTDQRMASVPGKGIINDNQDTARLGGASAGPGTKTVTFTEDPFTGQQIKKTAIVKTRNARVGETVMREEFIVDLGDI